MPRYLCLLQDADEIYVTADSVSMLSEAIFTGKPVGMIPVRRVLRGALAFAFWEGGLGGTPQPQLRAGGGGLAPARPLGTIDTPPAGGGHQPPQDGGKA